MRIGEGVLGFTAGEPSASVDFSDDSDNDISDEEFDAASILGSPP